MDEGTETLPDHGFYRFNSPVKKLNRSVYKKKMTSSRIDWNKQPLVQSDTIIEANRKPLDLSGTKLAMEERSKFVRVNKQKGVPQSHKIKSRSNRNASIESRKSKTSNTDYENQAPDSNRSHNFIEDIHTNTFNMQEAKFRERKKKNVVTLNLNSHHNNSKAKILLSKIDGESIPNLNGWHNTENHKPIPPVCRITKPPTDNAIGCLSIKDKIIELRNINKNKSISSHNNFEVREKRPKISDILQESNTLKNCYKNSNFLKSVEKPKNTEFKFFDHGLINLHAITNITRESVTQNQPRKLKSLHKRESSLYEIDVCKKINKTIDLTKSNANQKSQINTRSSSIGQMNYGKGFNKRILNGVKVDRHLHGDENKLNYNIINNSADIHQSIMSRHSSSNSDIR